MCEALSIQKHLPFDHESMSKSGVGRYICELPLRDRFLRIEKTKSGNFIPESFFAMERRLVVIVGIRFSIVSGFETTLTWPL